VKHVRRLLVALAVTAVTAGIAVVGATPASAVFCEEASPPVDAFGSPRLVCGGKTFVVVRPPGVSTWTSPAATYLLLAEDSNAPVANCRYSRPAKAYNCH
jgi:hypothetical protein